MGKAFKEREEWREDVVCAPFLWNMVSGLSEGKNRPLKRKEVWK